MFFFCFLTLKIIVRVRIIENHFTLGLLHIVDSPQRVARLFKRSRFQLAYIISRVYAYTVRVIERHKYVIKY